MHRHHLETEEVAKEIWSVSPSDKDKEKLISGTFDALDLVISPHPLLKISIST